MTDKSHTSVTGIGKNVFTKLNMMTIETLKYFSVVPRLEKKKIFHIISTFSYLLTGKIIFPENVVNLRGLKFKTRSKTLDSAYASDLYEKETTSFLLSLNPKIYIDVGAHTGRFVLLMANKGSEVIAFEPSDLTFKQLKENISLNNLESKIHSMNIGCSNNSGQEELFIHNSNEGATSFVKNDNFKGKEVHRIERLDKVCRDLNLNYKEIDVIKIDVEGYEPNVLEGSSDILKEGSPLLVIEILDSEKKEKIETFLHQFGYSCTKILDFRNFIFEKK